MKYKEITPKEADELYSLGVTIFWTAANRSPIQDQWATKGTPDHSLVHESWVAWATWTGPEGARVFVEVE